MVLVGSGPGPNACYRSNHCPLPVGDPGHTWRHHHCASQGVVGSWSYLRIPSQSADPWMIGLVVRMEQA